MTQHRYAWVAALPAKTLRELAALAERSKRPEFDDPAAAAVELADMLTKGVKPTLGWYRRHRRRVDSDDLAQGSVAGGEQGGQGPEQTPQAEQPGEAPDQPGAETPRPLTAPAPQHRHHGADTRQERPPARHRPPAATA